MFVFSLSVMSPEPQGQISLGTGSQMKESSCPVILRGTYHDYTTSEEEEEEEEEEEQERKRRGKSSQVCCRFEWKFVVHYSRHNTNCCISLYRNFLKVDPL
jgi:hypothetical protein